jgi:hypothetical protein
MACNPCEVGFQQYQSLVVSIIPTTGGGYVWLQNQGRNIILIKRIILCVGGSTFYLRPPSQPISWLWPYDTLETNTSANFYVFTAPSGTLVEAQAEYVELEGRSRSCRVTI